MKTRRLDGRIARRLHARTRAAWAADRTRAEVDEALPGLLANPDVRDISRAEKRRIADYAGDAFGDRRYFPWLYFYTLYRGEFVEGWVPDDFFQQVAIEHLNGRHRKFCSARTLFHRLLRTDRIPDLVYFVNGVWTELDGTPIDPAAVPGRIFAEAGTVCVKTEGSARGKGISVETRESFRPEAYADGGNLAVQRFIRQADFFDAMFPRAVATIRVTTGKLRAAPARTLACYLKLGLGADRTVNERALRVPILDRGGRLGEFGSDWSWRRHRRHPDTGFGFEGAAIPGFERALATCEELHDRLPQLRLIGWDATFAADGQVEIMELNAGQPGTRFLEMSVGPFLTPFHLERLAGAT